jgi:hypothetical protein
MGLNYFAVGKQFSFSQYPIRMLKGSIKIMGAWNGDAVGQFQSQNA